MYIILHRNNYPQSVRWITTSGPMHWQGGFPSLPVEIEKNQNIPCIQIELIRVTINKYPGKELISCHKQENINAPKGVLDVTLSSQCAI